MQGDVRTIRVRRGGREIERIIADLLRLPDGGVGALYGGLVFPVSDGDGIDIDDPGSAPSLCVPLSLTPMAWRFEAGPSGTDGYLFLDADNDGLHRAVVELNRAGLSAVRHGPNLTGTPGDWFVRLTDLTADASSRIAAALGEGSMPSGPKESGTLRERLLAEALDAATLATASLRSALARALADAADANSRAGAIDATVDRMNELAARLASADEEIASLRLRMDASPRPAASSKGIRTEVETVADTLLPRIEFLPGSLDFMALELSDRTSIWRTLGALDRQDRGQPEGWKPIAGRSGWWERHFSTGHDDQGRVYAKLGAPPRRWKVLVSHKQEQQGDIRRLD